MAIDKDKVRYVARLARMKLDENTLDDFTRQLDRILKYMEKLNQLDTENTPITSHVLGLKNVFRKDENKPSLDNQTVLSNAPEKEDNYFKVPKII